MVGLLDVAPVPRHVDIEGHRVDVPGVSAEGIAYLLEHFPQIIELQKLIGDGKDKKDDKDLGSALFALGPMLLHQVLAAGCGYPGNKEAIDRVAGMDLTSQTDLLDAILSKTLSKGLDHFLGRLNSIRATLSPPVTLADKVKEAVAQQKRKPSSTQLNSSSDVQVTQPEMSGA